MPFRFRRSIGPRWLHLVISKTGLSLSAGRPGMHVNYNLSHRRQETVAVARRTVRALLARQLCHST
jgi:hypothetical protein